MRTLRPHNRLLRHAAHLALGVAFASLCGARAGAQAAELQATPVPATRELPKPFARYSASAEALRDSIVALAKAQLGRKYVRGGTTPERGFDCSGLVKYIAEALHIDVPRTARQQSHAGLAVVRDTARLRPGDLLTFGRRKGVSHVGIYIGGGQFIHASTAAGRVIESKLDRPANRKIKPWLGVRRLLPDSDSVQVVSAGRPGR